MYSSLHNGASIFSSARLSHRLLVCLELFEVGHRRPLVLLHVLEVRPFEILEFYQIPQLVNEETVYP